MWGVVTSGRGRGDFGLVTPGAQDSIWGSGDVGRFVAHFCKTSFLWQLYFVVPLTICPFEKMRRSVSFSFTLLWIFPN